MFMVSFLRTIYVCYPSLFILDILITRSFRLQDQGIVLVIAILPQVAFQRLQLITSLN